MRSRLRLQRLGLAALGEISDMLGLVKARFEFWTHTAGCHLVFENEASNVQPGFPSRATSLSNFIPFACSFHAIHQCWPEAGRIKARAYSASLCPATDCHVKPSLNRFKAYANANAGGAPEACWLHEGNYPR